MKAPLSWLREYVDLPESVDARDVAAALVRQGLEVETVEAIGHHLRGPIVVARVLSIEELTEFKKPIRWVSVDAGESEPRWMICGARNFSKGDLVIVVKPGAVLPGNFEITARETYGRISDGMIVSARELGLSDDHSGIIVLPEHSAEAGQDALASLGLRDDVLDIAVTPDRGYALSIRGIAREVAIAFDVTFRDPADAVPRLPDTVGPRAVAIEDADAADRIVLRTVAGFSPSASTPWEMRRRLEMSGMRSISLAVDITNYVMLELGQPLHAFDDAHLQGPIRVRSANDAETLETLDHAVRSLTRDDAVIADDRGSLALAGVMGGLVSEMSESSTIATFEAAHFAPARIARTSRQHRLSSEASRRFERGVDPELGPIASARAVDLLTTIAGGQYVGGVEVDLRKPSAPIAFNPDFASALIGTVYSADTVRNRLAQVGCQIKGSDAPWQVYAPSWRPDLQMAEDLVEEIARLEGYDQIPSILPTPRGGRGLTSAQRLRRRLGYVIAARGGVEVLNYPFVGTEYFDIAGYSQDDQRRTAVRLANPLSEEEPFLRTSLLSGLITAAQRNISRGIRDLVLFEIGSVFLPSANLPHAPIVSIEHRPTDAELAALDAAIPSQPRHVGVLGVGGSTRSGWWGSAESMNWRSALEIADAIVAAAGMSFTRATGRQAPWHPGRCAQYFVGEQSLGFAGELHPRVCEAFGFAPHSIAIELSLDALASSSRIEAHQLVTMPVATEDIALVVDRDVPASTIEELIRVAGGELLEEVYLFDRYDGPQVGHGKVSLAFALTFRAADRTLTGDELAGLRSTIVTAAQAQGAQLR